MGALVPKPRGAAALLVAVLVGGCASVRATQARETWLASTFEPYRFARGCDELWPYALRVARERGYPVVGADPARLGDPPSGAFSQFLANGFASRRTPDGGLVAETDWNRQVGLRCRIRATPHGEASCSVEFSIIGGGAGGATEESLGPDWSMDLDLLRAVDPVEAARIEEAGPVSGR
jgi:hypothetical protein